MKRLSGIEPRIGIFWLADGELLIESIPALAARATESIRDSDADHYSTWERLIRKGGPSLLGCSYDHFPRGRIVYREQDETFVIYADRCLLENKRFMPEVRRAFALSSKQVKVCSSADLHYQCHKCNKFYLNDSNGEC